MRKIAQNLILTASLATALVACSQTPTQGPTSVTGVAYVGATVGNLENTTALYTQAAAVEKIESLNISGVKAIDILADRADVSISADMLRSVNAQVRYMQFDQTSPAATASTPVSVNGPGIAHLCFQVNQETQTYEKFLDLGAGHIGTKEMQQVNSRNPVYYGYVTDPDGLIVEVEHVDVPALNLETPPENEHRIRHISLATPDIDALTDFYGAFLGQPKPRRVGRLGGIGNEAMDGVSGFTGSKVKMAWFQTRNLELEIFEYTSHPVEPLSTPRPIDALGYNMIVFDVSDLAQAQADFIAAGGTIVTEASEMDGGQIVFGRDPDLNLIGLQLPAEGSIVNSSQFKNNGT